MTRLSAIVTLLLFAATAVAQTPGPPKAGDVMLTLRARPDLQKETLVALARILKYKTVRVDRTTSLKSFLREHYGQSIRPIRQLFAALNDTGPILIAGQIVKLPPAPDWRADTDRLARAPLSDDLSATQVVETLTGYRGQNTIDAIAKLMKISPEKVRKLERGRVTLPYVADIESFEVREEFAAYPDALQAQLDTLKKNDPALQFAEVGERYELIPNVRGLAANDPACPFKPLAAGALCDADSPRRYPVTRQTTVAVFDSGIAEGDKRFHFWSRPAKPPLPPGEEELFKDDAIGINLIRGGFPADDIVVDSHKDHGTHVSGIASCRLATDYLRNVNDRLRLMIVKIADKNAKVEPAAVLEGINYLKTHPVDIVNMSFVSTRSPRLHSDMTEMKGVLFVLAAGNGPPPEYRGKNLDRATTKVHPVELAYKLPNVITVAAYDGDFEIACFSNSGAQRAHIAAPGASVESTIAGKDNPRGRLSGTSQAAPFVTFAAAMLHARGLTNPVEIKYRLIYSADFHPGVKGDVYSDGVLNIQQALAYDSDIVHLAGRPPLYGTIAPRPALAVAGLEAPIPFTALRKVIAGYSGADAKVFYVDANGQPADKVGAVALPQLVLTDDKGVTHPIPPSSVREIIPRIR